MPKLLHQRRASAHVYRIAKVIGLLCGIASVVSSAFQKLPEVGATWLIPESVPGETYAKVRAWSLQNSWWFVPGCVLLAGVLLQINKWIGNPKSWDCIHSFLDAAQKSVFDPQKPQYKISPHHRVTLFKARCYRAWWDIVGVIKHVLDKEPEWLVAVARSNETDQGKITWFKIDGGNGCTGVCGQAWYSGSHSVFGLPEVGSKSPPAEIESYARQTQVSVNKVRKMLGRERKILARAILALRLRTNGRRWGVLVFDSLDPAQIDDTEVTRFVYLLQDHMSNLLEKTL